MEMTFDINAYNDGLIEMNRSVENSIAEGRAKVADIEKRIADLKQSATLKTKSSNSLDPNIDKEIAELEKELKKTREETSRHRATFRVTNDGSLYAEKAHIMGEVIATMGSFTGSVYATDGIFNGVVNATAGSFSGNVTATDFQSTGINSYRIVSYNLSELASQVIGRFPYTMFRINPDAEYNQLLIGQGRAEDDGKVMYIHNSHSSNNLELINGDYLTGILGRFNIQPRGTIQLIWSQAQNDWIIISYFQTPTGWRAN